jgi:hypothetical protein
MPRGKITVYFGTTNLQFKHGTTAQPLAVGIALDTVHGC